MSVAATVRTLAWLLPPVVVGMVLRLWNLAAQVMGDDEMHAVRAVLARPVSEILVTYQVVDNSIPLSALFRFLADCGGELTEWTFRLPSVVTGLAMLALVPPLLTPRLAARGLGRGPAIAFAWLLALSPGLVFFSRIARSYMPIVLLGSVAAIAFATFWRTGRRRWGFLYAAAAALATWLHLGAATFVATPFLFAAGDLAIHWDRRRAARLVGVGLSTVLAFLAFLVPARESLLKLVQDKHQPLAVTWPEVAAVAKLQAGSGWAPAAVLFWLLATAGLVRLARADRWLAAYTLTLAAGHLAGLLVLSPAGHEAPLVFSRYLLVSLPVVLLWVATALGSPWPGPPTALRRAGSPLATVTFLALLAVSGPFADPLIWRSPFAHTDDHLAFYTPRAELPADRIPDFYRQLATSPEAGPVIEYPWIPVWRVNRAFYLYQEIHGQDVVVAPEVLPLGDQRLAFRNMVPGDPGAFLASRARWLVVHRHLGREEGRVQERELYLPLRIGVIKPRAHQRFWDSFRDMGSSMGNRLKREWGPADYADRRIRVWDLERVRRERATGDSGYHAGRTTEPSGGP